MAPRRPATRTKRTSSGEKVEKDLFPLHTIKYDEKKLRPKLKLGPTQYVNNTGELQRLDHYLEPAHLDRHLYDVWAELDAMKNGVISPQLQRDIDVGILETREAAAEFIEKWTKHEFLIAEDRKRSDKEMPEKEPVPPVMAQILKAYQRETFPAFQRTPSPPNEKGLAIGGLRQCYEVMSRVPSRDYIVEESNIRPEVAPHTNSALENAFGQAMPIEDIDMTAFNDPFDGTRLEGDEVLAILKCIRFNGNPVGNLAKRPHLHAMANLPYPLCEVPFLQKFVKPLFLADDWLKCEHCHSKFGLTKLSRSKWDGSYDGRIAKCFAVGKRIVAMVDAMEKEWQAPLIKTEREAMANVHFSSDSPSWTFKICNAAHKALEQKVHEEMSEHACHFWRYCRTVALLRAEKWMEAHLTGKPIGPVELPIPYPPLDADLLKLMGRAAPLVPKDLDMS